MLNKCPRRVNNVRTKCFWGSFWDFWYWKERLIFMFCLILSLSLSLYIYIYIEREIKHLNVIKGHGRTYQSWISFGKVSLNFRECNPMSGPIVAKLLVEVQVIFWSYFQKCFPTSENVNSVCTKELRRQKLFVQSNSPIFGCSFRKLTLIPFWLPSLWHLTLDNSCSTFGSLFQVTFNHLSDATLDQLSNPFILNCVPTF